MDYFKNVDWLWLADKLVMPVCILAVALFAGITLNSMLHKKLAERIQNDDESRIKNIFFNALQGLPISMCLIIGLYWIVNTNTYLPAGLVNLFSYLLFAVVVVTFTRVVERTLSGFVTWKLEASGETSQSSLLHTIFKTVIYASSALIILQEWGISIAPIVTAMGVGGMAIAFGVQETVANIFSGLHLIISKQIKINDVIRLSSGAEGRVTDINFRYTTLTPANDGSVVIIPNKDIAGAVMTNFSRPREDIVIVVPIGVGYESDLEKVERVTVEVAKEVMARVDGYEPIFDEDGNEINPMSPVVRYQEFGDSSINFNAVLHATVFVNQFMIKHEFIKAISKRYREEGINIPFPIRTLDIPEKVDVADIAEKIKTSKKKG